MARRRLTGPPPAPWPSLVLDSQGLWAAARNESEDLRAALAATAAAGRRVLLPSIVLAEALFGDPGRDAPVNQVVKQVDVVDVDSPIARDAALLKRRAGMAGEPATIDAIVVAVSAAAGGGMIVTSDRKDIERLAAAVSEARVKVLRV